jgi:activator of HSP90 ATPase
MPKIIQQTVTFSAPPEKLFDMYMNQKLHATITGQPVTISRTAGTRFRAFGGMIVGKMLHVVPRRLIIQSWRSKEWKPEDLDSTLIISFWSDQEGGRIELTHVNVPEYDYNDVNEGWEKFYWKPWREYLLKKVAGVGMAKAA